MSMRPITHWREAKEGETYVEVPGGGRYALPYGHPLWLLHLASAYLSGARRQRESIRECGYRFSKRTRAAMHRDLRNESARAIAYTLRAVLALRAGLL